MAKSHIEIEKVGPRRQGCIRFVMLGVLVAVMVSMVLMSVMQGL